MTEGLRFRILLEKHFRGGWDVQVVVPATSATGCDKKWRAACLLPGTVVSPFLVFLPAPEWW